ncbi:glycosyltransferase family 2 protein [Microbacterium sufflavum]|uniref:Glycosyltransferase family 2 protein n=1 Tax=Microbacterium sufflavum TaxID=2851649 RepID=A0ABY4IET2_9MICO|nr:glycosyltransferase family 2 protein [Microbacterium sufflavum]UPL11283.1 glycosyltransferase family 2 protein [Microbacterium sufflavum]
MAQLGYFQISPRPATPPEDSVTLRHLAIVMPAYNEAEGIRGFVDEIRASVASLADVVSFHVADDRSTDGTAAVFDDVDDVTVEVQPLNRGHGPTALAAYRAGLAADPDALVHVDGDGQFHGSDFPRLIGALISEDADVVHGVRDGRTDPWYRKVLTGAVGVLIASAAGRRVPDVNTPLRAYRPEALRTLIDAVPTDASVPHVHFSLAEARAGFVVRYLRVASIPRRGVSTTGTMWGRGAGVALPPKRLRLFVRSALGEAWQLSLRPSAPLRRIRRPEPVAR